MLRRVFANSGCSRHSYHNSYMLVLIPCCTCRRVADLVALGRATSADDVRGGEYLVSAAVAPDSPTATRDARDAERSTRCDCGGALFARLIMTPLLLLLGLGLVTRTSPFLFLVALYVRVVCTGNKRGKNQVKIGFGGAKRAPVPTREQYRFLQECPPESIAKPKSLWRPPIIHSSSAVAT